MQGDSEVPKGPQTPKEIEELIKDSRELRRIKGPLQEWANRLKGSEVMITMGEVSLQILEILEKAKVK